MGYHTRDLEEKLSEESKRVRKIIEEKDRLIHLFGMKVDDVCPGRAVVSMTVGEHHVNAANVCHGATMFALADVAFALACNSHGDLALAVDMSISFLRAVSSGEHITATCTERHRGKRLGSYHIEVTNATGTPVALLKATAFVTDQRLEAVTDFSGTR
jgi:acyl-CoA thioesterase